MEIKIYAPVDGEVDIIENLNDGVFSEKMLGDGFFIKATERDFYSPIDKGKINLITDTQHAYFLEVDGVNVLMHIGIDTVTLKGKPFKVEVEVGNKVSLETKIVNVDLEMIKNLGLNYECPITVDGNGKNYKFTLLTKSKKVKRGELIGKFELIESNVKEDEVPKDAKTFFSMESIYQKLAREINELVGGVSNYSDVYNCMTRLRFMIRDKSIVKQPEIKALGGARGLVWNGDELQVVIGQDVYKVKDEVIKQNENLAARKQGEKAKPSFIKRFMTMFGGTMVPIIPIFVGAGIIQAVIGILQLTGIMPATLSFAKLGELADVDWWWVVLLAIGKTSTFCMGIMIAVSFANYMKFSPIFGVVIGMILCSPALFIDGGQTGMGGQWIIFDFGEVKLPDEELTSIINMTLSKFKITPGGLKIFVIIGSVFLAKTLDDFLKQRIAPVLDLITRPFLVIFISTAVGIVGLMPVWNMFEGVFGMLFYFIGKIPFGLGVGIYAAMWQVAVIFGSHIPLAIVAMIQVQVSSGMGYGGYSMFGLGQGLSVYAQVGALIGLVIISKNALERNKMIGLIPVGFVGITEPILYGYNLPKKKPLLAGVTASFIGASIASALGVTSRVSTGLGVFEFIGFFQNPVVPPKPGIIVDQLNPIANGIIYMVCCAITLGLSIGFTIFMCRERVSEKEALAKQSRKIIKTIYKIESLSDVISAKNDYKINKEKIKELKILISKEDMNTIKEIEKLIQQELKIKNNISKIRSKESKMVEKLMLKGKKLVASQQLDKADIVKNEIQAIDFSAEINLLNNELKEIQTKNDLSIIDEIINRNLVTITSKMFEIKSIDKLDKDVLVNNLNNALNEMRIAYNIDKKKEEFNFTSENAKIKLQKIENKKQAKLNA